MIKIGKKQIGRYVILNVFRGKEGEAKMGITVSRRFGKAHERNRFKRVVREAYRYLRHHLPEGMVINVRPRTLASTATPADIIQEIMSLTD